MTFKKLLKGRDLSLEICCVHTKGRLSFNSEGFYGRELVFHSAKFNHAPSVIQSLEF